MEVARHHGLTEKSTNILDGTPVKPESELNTNDRADIKLVNGKSSDIYLNSQMDDKLGNESDSNEAHENHKDIKNCGLKDGDDKEIMQVHNNENKDEETIENRKEQNGFEDISEDESEPVASKDGGNTHDSVDQDGPMESDTDKLDNENVSHSNKGVANVSSSSSTSNSSDCALDDKVAADSVADESIEKDKIEKCDESSEERDITDNALSGVNTLEVEGMETQKNSEKCVNDNNKVIVEKKNEEPEDSGEKCQEKDRVPIDSAEKSREKLTVDEESRLGKIKDESSTEGDSKYSPTSNPKETYSQKSDDVIVLDDGDDEPEVKKKDKKLSNNKSPIIVNYYSMSKEPAKSDETSAKSSKVTASKDQSGSKPQPVPEFAKDLRPMSMNLCTIGMNLVREHVYNDLIKIQSKKLAQNKLNDMAQKQLNIIKTAAKALEGENKPFKMPLKECARDKYPECGFLTESDSVMELHKDFPHGTIGNFRCSFCEFFSTRKQELVFHMEAIHCKQARFVPSFSYLVCCFCKFETDNPKGFNKHVIKCAKTFNLKRNLEPSPADCDIPLKKPKPAKPLITKNPKQTVARQIAASTIQQQPKQNSRAAVEVVSRGSKQTITIHPPAAPATANATVIRPPVAVPQIPMAVSQQANKLINIPGIRPASNTSYPYPQYLIGNTYYTVVNHNGQLMLQPSTMVSQGTTGVRPGVPTAVPGPKLAAPGLKAAANPPLKISGNSVNQAPANQPQTSPAENQKKFTPAKSVSKKLVRTILDQKKNTPVAPPVPSGVKPSGFKVCEICGGFVKDIQSLQIHFYWKHNIEIPKDVDEPGFTCFLCEDPKAFWTIKGLEMHQAQEHGMGSAAKSVVKTKAAPMRKKDGTQGKPIILSPNKKKASGPEHGCYLCGIRSNAILQHLLESHRVSINTMSKMKKCLVCGLELGSLINLHTHLQQIHGLLTKNIISPPAAKAIEKVTQIKQTQATVCHVCKLSFSSLALFSKHFETHHSHKCYRCDKTWSTKEALLKHYATSHKMDKDDCQICGASVMIGSSFIRHVKRLHIKSFSVALERMSDNQIRKWMKSPTTPSGVTSESEAKKTPQKRKLENDDHDTANCVQEVIEVDGEKIILEVYSSDEEKVDS